MALDTERIIMTPLTQLVSWNFMEDNMHNGKSVGHKQNRQIGAVTITIIIIFEYSK